MLLLVFNKLHTLKPNGTIEREGLALALTALIRVVDGESEGASSVYFQLVQTTYVCYNTIS